MKISSDKRLEREKQFHNERFTEETRTNQEKYYLAIKDAHDNYTKIITRLSLQSDVLEYGCAKGGISLSLAKNTSTIRGIDISDVAIAKANSTASKLNLNNASFYTMNAEAMDFPDNSFDLVFGSGIIHHLDIEKSFNEISRVLKPNGKAIFIEPLGHNPLINLYRLITPKARTPDEHPLLVKDLKIAEKYFSDFYWEPYGLATLGYIPFRNFFLSEKMFKLLKHLDNTMFKINVFKKYAWFSLIIAQK